MTIGARRQKSGVTGKATLAAVALSLLLNPLSSFAQGDLAPPGAPAPTMKTLEQVEPRTPVDATNTPGDADSVFKITQAGSYYLTGNVVGDTGKHGIEIVVGGVSLDLMGFEILGMTGSLDGIHIPFDSHNVAIRNGKIRDWDGKGVHAPVSINSLFERLHVESNGDSVSDHGMDLGGGCQVVSCVVRLNGGDGIQLGTGGIVKDCISSNNGDDGIDTGGNALVHNCTASGNNGNAILVGSRSIVSGCAVFNSITADGIKTASRSQVIDCVSVGNAADGIDVGVESIVRNCKVANNTEVGIRAGGNCIVTGSSASGNQTDGILVASLCLVTANSCQGNGEVVGDAAGIHVTGSRNRVEGNTVISNDRGIDVDGINNLIVRNSAGANTTEYDIAANNQVGTISTDPTTAGPWDNFDL